MVQHAENTTISDFPKFSGGQQFDIAPTSVKIISYRYAIFIVDDGAVGFPNGNIDRVAGIEDVASGRDMYRASHWLRIDWVINRVEDAFRVRQFESGYRVGKLPSELDCVKFRVGIGDFRGEVCDENWEHCLEVCFRIAIVSQREPYLC